MEAAALPRAGVRPVVRRVGGDVPDEDLVARVRAGDDRAFELLFDRHARGLLAFCRHLLGSPEEAEDAVQHTMLAAYRAIGEHDRELHLKPWLYAVARNRCLSVIRARRDEQSLERASVATEGLAAEVARRADLRELLADVAGLPEEQRAALVLFELGDHTHDEIAGVLGVRRDKVKALVFQAREHLMAARAAREAPCEEIRAELATATGPALRRGLLRRHVERCAGCRAYEEEVRRQRAALAVALPVLPTLALKHHVLTAVGTHAGAAGAASAAGGAAGAAAGGSGITSLAGAGVNGVVAKVLVVAALAGGAGASAEVAVHRIPRGEASHATPATPDAPSATVGTRRASPATITTSSGPARDGGGGLTFASPARTSSSPKRYGHDGASAPQPRPDAKRTHRLHAGSLNGKGKTHRPRAQGQALGQHARPGQAAQPPQRKPDKAAAVDEGGAATGSSGAQRPSARKPAKRTEADLAVTAPAADATEPAPELLPPAAQTRRATAP